MGKQVRDFLDEMIAERTAKNPEFPKLLAAAEARLKAKRAREARKKGNR